MRCRDVGLATVLVLSGYRPTHVYAVAPGRVEFMFLDEPAVFALQREYLAGQARVDARAFLRTYKELMGEIHKVNGSRPATRYPNQEETTHGAPPLSPPPR